MTPETAKRLLDPHTAATELLHFIEGYNADSFDQDLGVQLIVHKVLAIIGKAPDGASPR